MAAATGVTVKRYDAYVEGSFHLECSPQHGLCWFPGSKNDEYGATLIRSKPEFANEHQKVYGWKVLPAQPDKYMVQVRAIRACDTRASARTLCAMQ